MDTEQHNDHCEPPPSRLAQAPCSAYVLLSVRVDNLFTREQLEERGIGEHDMVLECFENPLDLVSNGDDLTVEDVDVHWPNVEVSHPDGKPGMARKENEL